jgi:hypothetical protein
MKIDEDSILFTRICCPSQCRQFNAFAVASNGTFEFGRFERDYKCVFWLWNRPEIRVYKTERNYYNNDVDDEESEEETLIGRVVNPFLCGTESCVIFEDVEGFMKPRYEVKGAWCNAQCISPLPLSGSSTEFKITDIGAKATYHKNLFGGEYSNSGKILKEFTHCTKECCSPGC